MLELLIGIFFLLIVGAIWALITYWLPILIVILSILAIIVIIYCIYDKALKKKISRVVRARIVSKQPIFKTITEQTGFTRSYGRYYSYHEHFRDREVIVGYRVIFSVEYENGERDTITCKEDSYAYNQLVKIPDTKRIPIKDTPPLVKNTPPAKLSAPSPNPKPANRISPPENKTYSSPKKETTVAREKSVLETVRSNLSVEKEVFDRYGMNFKCNLVPHYTSLQLNYELSGTKQLASKVEKDTDLEIKANVYDANGNLLCIKEEYVEYSQLRRGYAADYFYFTSEEIVGAHSMKVYAIDPTEDYDDWDEEDFEEEPTLDYGAIYTYCEVAFYEGGKCFHYRTENPELKVGDQVYVPVGYQNQEKIGTIVSIANYVGHEAPFPLEKTKLIIGKVEETNR